MRAYLFYSDGAPITERRYYAPGHFVRDQAFCDFERPLSEGDAPLVHMGHGHFTRFVCAAVDAEHALLVASEV